jgi:2-oxo-3-hexenedioate decarboxylase
MARQMLAAQDHARQIEPFTSQFTDFDVPAGYAVAELIHQVRVRRGALSVGRKIGFTNPDMWAIYGVQEPIWAYVYDTTVVHLGGERHTCSLGKFTEPKIEPEIILHFHQVPPSDGNPASILACIDWVAHGFEIVQSHFPGWKFRAADTIADLALHGTLMVGEPQPIDRLGPDLIASLERFSLNLLCNGQCREVGRGVNVLGSPLRAVAHLIAVLERQHGCLPLHANELVTTGTITTAQSVHAGQVWQTEIQGIALPNLSVEFTP